jgi:hypothetical protein
LRQKNEIRHNYLPFGSLNPFTVQINPRLSMKLYRDCRPAYLETAPLQKGLVLLLDGRELIEEGVGFGVPVAKYKDKTYFSSSAKSWIETDQKQCILVKSFVLDTISRKRFEEGPYFNDKLYHLLHSVFELGYVNFTGLAQAFNRLMELRKKLGLKTEFIRVKPRGTAIFKYSYRPDEIQITAEISLLGVDQCKEILILNEQGSSFFRRYVDSSGLLLFGRKIGAWTKITADEAYFSNLKQTLTFSMKNNLSTPLFRGWEKTVDRFSWSGLAYSLPPRNSTICYSIKLKLGED